MRRQVRVTLLLLLVLPLLMQGGSLPHTHSDDPEGFFNQEHDLTLLAITGTVGSLDAGVPFLVLTLVVIAVASVVRCAAAPARAHAASSRAPPAR
jgi:hypothetical protein